MTHLIRYADRVLVVKPGVVTVEGEMRLCWADDDGKVICFDKEPDWALEIATIEEKML